MADERKEDIGTTAGTWLLGATGSAWMAVAAAVGPALAALLSAHLSKTHLLYIIGAEALSILAFLFLVHRAFAGRSKALAEAKAALEIAKKESSKSPVADCEWDSFLGAWDGRDGNFYCQKCAIAGHRSPMKKEAHGTRYRCLVCQPPGNYSATLIA